MIFVKPEGLRYVDMCIWIDENAYKEECDDNKLFEYLYFIAIMLAHKAKYFYKTKDYEDFAIFMATRAYFRLRNSKQYQYNDDGEPKMTKLKSILNYMKSILYPCKVDFQQQFYAQTKVEIDDLDYHSEYSFSDKLNDTVDELTRVEFSICLSDTHKSIREFLKKIPYKTNSSEWQNIYMSCLLSFLNSITLSNDDVSRIANYQNISRREIESVNRLCEQQLEDNIILFHLDNNMKNYIAVLVREIKHIIALELSKDLKTYVPAHQGVESLVIPILNGEVNNEY